jgi:hypothetical protein
MLHEVDEVQYLNCVGDSGYFALSFRFVCYLHIIKYSCRENCWVIRIIFRLDTTNDIPANTTARNLYLALKKLPSIRELQVSFVKLSSDFTRLTE